MKKQKSKDLYKEGTVHLSNNYGNLVIVTYVNPKSIKIKFVDTGSEAVVTASQIKLGSVRDKNKPSLFGIGKLGYGVHKGTQNGKESYVYTLWKNMLAVCYREDNMHFAFYKDCSVTEDWKTFQNFAEWYEYHKQEEQKMRLRLKEGKKVFSPSNCRLEKSGKIKSR